MRKAAILSLTLAACGCTAPAAQTGEATQMPAKTADGLFGKRWRLVELNGQPVPKLEREPYLVIEADGGRVTGFGGCNSFSGTYTLEAGVMRIRFGQLVSTMKACVTGMDVEKAFSDVLGRVDNYSLNGDRLALNRARMAPLARFEAADQT